jgi:hypothetical protein
MYFTTVALLLTEGAIRFVLLVHSHALVQILLARVAGTKQSGLVLTMEGTTEMDVDPPTKMQADDTKDSKKRFEVKKVTV